MMESDYSPIALFVYNRPTHTHKTIDALLKNQLSKESDLIIFSDAPKSGAQAEAVQEVRQYIREIAGFRSVTIVEREANYGLARSIIDGVTSVVKEHGRIIVLEDDLIVAPYFLDFMNSALDVYENEGQVMHISGYMFPNGNLDLPDTLFLRTTSCWGWATWARAWKSFEPDTKILLDAIRERKLEYEFDIHGTVGYTEMLKNQLTGDIDSWAVRWYASVFLNGGLCLHPARSLVNNIGHDGTGVHCGSSKIYEADVSGLRPIVKKRAIQETIGGLEVIKQFYRSSKRPFYVRIIAKFTRSIKNLKWRFS